MKNFLTFFLLFVALFSAVEGERRLRTKVFDASPVDENDNKIMDRVWQRYLNMATEQEGGEAQRILAMSMEPSDETPLIPVGAEVFLGTYSDPNHPGELRVIKKLEGCAVGEYQPLEVYLGNPENTMVPAVALGARNIIIDFSSKGGPQDFFGVSNSGNIEFVDDGNVWTKL